MSGRGVAIDWEARFRAERAPWERPTIHPAFTAWRKAGDLAPCRILVPGAGRSGEPLALARDGFDVTIVDVSPSATAVQRVRLQAAGVEATVVEANLLTWTPDKPFDAVYDQACLCALPPWDRSDYANRMQIWLRPGGKLLILFMQTGQPSGPPYDCSLEAMKGVFAQGWQWPHVLGKPVPAGTNRQEQPAILIRI